MAIIQASYLHMVGDMFIGEWDFQADVETSLNEVGDPYVSSVSDVKLLQGDGALSIELNSDDQFLATLCRAIQEHCESDESILEQASEGSIRFIGRGPNDPDAHYRRVA